MDLGLPELAIILLIVLLLFGSTRLPKLSRSLGEAMRELRNGMNGTDAAPADKQPEAKDKQEPDPEKPIPSPEAPATTEEKQVVAEETPAVAAKEKDKIKT